MSKNTKLKGTGLFLNQDMRIRENSSVLEKLAEAYPAKSLEHQALKISAFAFAYVILHHEKDFDKYVGSLHKPLTKRERQKLGKLLTGHE